MPSLAIATVTLLGTLAAQAPDATLQSSPDRARQLPPAAVADLDTVAVDAADPTTLWAAGPTWKASFAADGTLFVPCFGATAPRNFPARLARATVHVGGKLLTTETNAPVLTGDTVQFAGPAFTERYVLSLSGIEQQFVLPTGLVGWVVGLPYNLALPICPGCIQGAEGSAVLGQSYSFAVPRNGACLAQINLSNALDATIR